MWMVGYGASVLARSQSGSDTPPRGALAAKSSRPARLTPGLDQTRPTHPTPRPRSAPHRHGHRRTRAEATVVGSLEGRGCCSRERDLLLGSRLWASSSSSSSSKGKCGRMCGKGRAVECGQGHSHADGGSIDLVHIAAGWLARRPGPDCHDRPLQPTCFEVRTTDHRHIARPSIGRTF